jgi:Protein of unknown function (DUF1573)
MKTSILIITLLTFASITARAGLKWEQTQLELHPAPGDKQAIGHFKYQNADDKPVQFKSVHSSCGCTIAQTQKERVEPGETGEITATFNIGDRTGTQVKTVTVETNDPKNTTTVLTLKAVLPELLQIQPPLVSWSQGEQPKPKIVSVRPSKDFRVGALRVTSSNPQLFSTKVTANQDKNEFKIEVTPTDTAHPATGVLTIQPDNSPRVFYATTRVMSVAAAQ